VAACAGETAPDSEGTWLVDHTEDGGVLLSVWGSGPSDLWVAGGQVDRGLILRGDGASWTPVETGATSLLWWVYGFSATDVYAVGSRGLILHYDGETWERVESGTDRTLYGVWGASKGDVWIVGGEPGGAAGEAVVLRGQGRSFQRVWDVPAELLPGAVFKVYGYTADDVILVGSGGTVLRWDGRTWRRDEVPTSAPIFSLWGRGPDDIYAVGGEGGGTVLHYAGGDGWTQVSDDSFGRGLSGVFTAPDSPLIAVGTDSYVLEISPEGTKREPELPYINPMPVLHGVWGDDSGTTYAVGGDLLAFPDPMSGVIFRRH
jgi:hypothetical protein